MSSGTSYGGGGSTGDFSSVEKHAKHHAGKSADRGIFDSAMSAIQQNAGSISNGSVDEEHMVKSHKKHYKGDSSSSSGGEEATTGSMGSAAAMQALKMFSGGDSSSSSESSGGSTQSAFMGMAMGQAAKLFDQQSESGNVSSSASKQSVVQEAGEQALKMYMSSEMGGGSSSGLMSMAAKFM